MIAAEQHTANVGPFRDTGVHEVKVTLPLSDVTTAITADAVTFTLDPDSARYLAQQLDIAAETPRTCTYCHRLVEKPSSLTDLCATCQTREDMK